ncbi:mannitol dehydrogenase family protein [Herbiconiux sp.]|jgi:fructuronate reductase|uniref:mannitol dehydrogenase family protein n=1 Tax=Herbiconiux sp. TaxID=1871186 RepID=UPI0025BCE710|nr:mannitol dehydrogenase family protein [Herbiconiux sp.]
MARLSVTGVASGAQHRLRPERSAPAPATGIVHLGLGAFHRAHQAAFTAEVDPERRWGIAAFTGRSPVEAALERQDGVYTLLEAGARPGAQLIEQLSSVRSGQDRGAFRSAVADPRVSVLTLTITERGYRLGADGRLDLRDDEVRSDIAALRGECAGGLATAPGRIVDALAVRRASTGPLTVVSCDNLAGNGAATRAAVLGLAGEVDESLAGWIEREIAFPSTAVDRITPRPDARVRELAEHLTGVADDAAVLTERHREWVLEDSFAAERPAWERAGALVVDDVVPFETRKLLLLNAAHTLLALEGRLRGHETVRAAFADPELRRRVEALWDEAARLVPAEAGSVEGYRAQLAERFAEPGIDHRLAQIAQGSGEKLRIRIVPTVLAERAAGRSGRAALRAVAAHLTGSPQLRDGIAELHRPWADDDGVLDLVEEIRRTLPEQPPGHPLR